MPIETVHGLSGKISIYGHQISGKVAKDDSGIVSGTLHVVSGTPAKDIYNGAYVVDPLVRNGIVLATNGKYCRDNITVNKVPRYETTNPSGGLTMYIGETGE